MPAEMFQRRILPKPEPVAEEPVEEFEEEVEEAPPPRKGFWR
jgi:hypothetical protein